MAAESISRDVINVVDRYLSVEMVKALNSDAGWRSDSRMSQLIEYLGEIPEFTAGGNSNGAMIHQLGLMFNEPDDPRTLWSCAAMALLKNQGTRKHSALVAYVFYRNRPDYSCDPARDYHTNERIAELEDMSRSAFCNNLKQAEGFIRDLINLSRLSGKLDRAA